MTSFWGIRCSLLEAFCWTCAHAPAARASAAISNCVSCRHPRKHGAIRFLLSMGYSCRRGAGGVGNLCEWCAARYLVSTLLVRLHRLGSITKTGDVVINRQCRAQHLPRAALRPVQYLGHSFQLQRKQLSARSASSSVYAARCRCGKVKRERAVHRPMGGGYAGRAQQLPQRGWRGRTDVLGQRQQSGCRLVTKPVRVRFAISSCVRAYGVGLTHTCLYSTQWCSVWAHCTAHETCTNLVPLVPRGARLQARRPESRRFQQPLYGRWLAEGVRRERALQPIHQVGCPCSH